MNYGEMVGAAHPYQRGDGWDGGTWGSAGWDGGTWGGGSSHVQRHARPWHARPWHTRPWHARPWHARPFHRQPTLDPLVIRLILSQQLPFHKHHQKPYWAPTPGGGFAKQYPPGFAGIPWAWHPEYGWVQ